MTTFQLIALEVEGDYYTISEAPFTGQDFSTSQTGQPWVFIPGGWRLITAGAEPVYIGGEKADPRETAKLAPGESAYIFLVHKGGPWSFALWVTIKVPSGTVLTVAECDEAAREIPRYVRELERRETERLEAEQEAAWKRDFDAHPRITVEESYSGFGSHWRGYRLVPEPEGGITVLFEEVDNSPSEGRMYTTHSAEPVSDVGFFIWRQVRSNYYWNSGDAAATIETLSGVSALEVRQLATELNVRLSLADAEIVATVLPDIMAERVGHIRGWVWEQRAYFDVRALIIEACKRIGFLPDDVAAAFLRYFEDSRQPRFNSDAMVTLTGATWRVERGKHFTIRRLTRVDGSVYLAEPGSVNHKRYGFLAA